MSDRMCVRGMKTNYIIAPTFNLTLTMAAGSMVVMPSTDTHSLIPQLPIVDMVM